MNEAKYQVGNLVKFSWDAWSKALFNADFTRISEYVNFSLSSDEFDASVSERIRRGDHETVFGIITKRIVSHSRDIRFEVYLPLIQRNVYIAECFLESAK